VPNQAHSALGAWGDSSAGPCWAILGTCGEKLGDRGALLSQQLAQKPRRAGVGHRLFQTRGQHGRIDRVARARIAFIVSSTLIVSVSRTSSFVARAESGAPAALVRARTRAVSTPVLRRNGID
jgi:hypothetical protein